MSQASVPLILTSPHSGEDVPPEAVWLKSIDRPILLKDVDRYVDTLIEPAAQHFNLKVIKTPWLRTAVDLNREADDIDETTVAGSEIQKKTFAPGVHWDRTSDMVRLMQEPISVELHLELIRRYYKPFHDSLEAAFRAMKRNGHKSVLHLDCHSMASKGRGLAKDGFEMRPDIVISDRNGTSAGPAFPAFLIEILRSLGLRVSYNHPYQGARILKHGRPSEGLHSVQLEINRALYMNESTFELTEGAAEFRQKFEHVISSVVEQSRAHRI